MKKTIICVLVAMLLCVINGVVFAESDLDIFQNAFKVYMEADYQRLPVQKYNDPEGQTGMIWAGYLPSDTRGMYPWFARIRTEGGEISYDSFAKQYALTSAYFEQQHFVPCNECDSIHEAFLEGMYLRISEDCDYRFIALKANENENGEYANDELYILARLRDKEVSKTWNFVAITDQKVVLAIVKSLFQDENNRAGFPNRVIQWLSRRQESGFLAPVIIVEDEISETEQSDLPTAYVRIQEKSDVNVRQKPNTESKRLGRAKAGKEYKWLSTASNGWYEIQLDEDTTGYVSNKVTTLIEK